MAVPVSDRLFRYSFSAPDEIRSGRHGECIASKTIAQNKVLVVAYREVDSTEGFVITAFLTRRLKWLRKKKKIWP